MDTDDRIRSRIEAILTNDARNRAEVQRVASEEDVCRVEGPDEERDLYLRVISTYRSAIAQVNSRLEENVWFLSGFYRILENIKEEGDFREICLRVVDSVLREFGAEYCAIVISNNQAAREDPFIVEGINEGERFVRVHSSVSLAGSEQLPALLKAVAKESPDGVTLGDVYRDLRFQAIDFPSVIRSLACLSITLHKIPIGMLVLGHSCPQRFSEDHIRILRILAGLLAHARRLTADRNGSQEANSPLPDSSRPERDGILSLVILKLQVPGPANKYQPLDREAILSFRRSIDRELASRESVLLYMEKELLVLLPGTPAEEVPVRVGRLHHIFECWKAEQGERAAAAKMDIGYSTCRTDEDLASMLEVAAAVMHQQQHALSA